MSEEPALEQSPETPARKGRLRRGIALVVLVLGLVIAGGYAALYHFLDGEKARSLIVRQAQTALGRELTIGAPVDIKIGLRPTIVLRDVTLANAAWSKRGPMLKAETFAITLEVLPLLRRQVVVNDVSLTGAAIILEQTAAGDNNWTFVTDDAAKQPEADSADAEGAPAGAAALPLIQQARIHKTSLVYYGPDGSTQRVRIDDLTVAEQGGDSAVVRAAGAYSEIPFSVEATLRDLPTVLAGGQVLPFSVRLAVLDSVVDARGQAQLSGPLDAQVQLSLKTGNTLAVTQALKQPALPYQAVSLQTDVVLRPDAVRLTKINGVLGGLSVQGSGQVQMDQALRPQHVSATLTAKAETLAAALGTAGEAIGPAGALGRVVLAVDGGMSLKNSVVTVKTLEAEIGRNHARITGKINLASQANTGVQVDLVAHSKALYLADFQEAKPVESQDDAAGQPVAPPPSQTAAAPADGRLFSDQPLPFAALMAVGGVVSVGIDALYLDDEAPLKDVALAWKQKAGAVDLTLTKPLVFPQGMRVQGAVSGNVATTTLKPQLTITSPDMGGLLKNFGVSDQVEGLPARLVFSGQTAGVSARALAANLNGQIQLAVGKGYLKNGYLDMLGQDLLRLLTPFVKIKDKAEVACVAGQWTVKNGLAQPDIMIGDGSRARVWVDGKVRLTDETLNLDVVTQAKKTGIGTLTPPVSVGGTLASPRFGLNTGSAVGTALTTAALTALNPAALALPLIGIGSDVDVCGALLRVEEGEAAPFFVSEGIASITADQPSGNPVMAPVETFKDLGKGVGKGLEETFKGLFGQ